MQVAELRSLLLALEAERCILEGAGELEREDGGECGGGNGPQFCL